MIRKFCALNCAMLALNCAMLALNCAMLARKKLFILSDILNWLQFLLKFRAGQHTFYNSQHMGVDTQLYIKNRDRVV